MKIMTLLQGKGSFLICLLLHAENVQKINSAIFGSEEKRWSSRNQNCENKGFGNGKFQSESEQCGPSKRSSGVVKQSKFSRDVTRQYTRRFRILDHLSKSSIGTHNCQECFLTLDEGQIEKICSLRGGDLIVNDAIKVTMDSNMIKAVTPYNVPLYYWKVIFQVILTTINVVCWFVPLKNKKFTQNKLALSLANAFSGGVFLSLAFGHLLPECVHGFHGYGYNQAVPYMAALGGYLLIFFVEKVAFDTNSLIDSDCSDGENDCDDSNDIESIGTGRGALMLLSALAVHSVLEMTALGLADSFSDSAILSLSIALHQPAESVALLIAFLKSGLSEKKIVQYLSAFSTMGPIGVGIGIAVKEFAAPILESIMLALVAGTFIYVGATEVIPEEWEESDNKWKKFICLMTGIISIFGITQYTMTFDSEKN